MIVRESTIHQRPQVDFSMDTQAYKSKELNWLAAMFSHTLLIFYGVMVMATLIAMLILSDTL